MDSRCLFIFQGCEACTVHDAKVDMDGMVVTVEGRGVVDIPLIDLEEEN